jgi:hypothetical protein
MSRYRVENEPYAGMLRRMLGAFAKRVAATDPNDLRHFADLERHVAEARATAVAGLREQGYSWAEIGRGLKVTKQEAQRRYGK